MRRALLCLLLAGLRAAAASTTGPTAADAPVTSHAPTVPATVPEAPAAPRVPVVPRAPAAVPEAPAASRPPVPPRPPFPPRRPPPPPGPDPAIAAVQDLLADIGLRLPQPLHSLSCDKLQPSALPSFSHLSLLPRVLVQSAMVLVQRQAGCRDQAMALARELVQTLGTATAQSLLRALQKLHATPTRSRLPQLYELVLMGSGVPVAPCNGLTAVSGMQLRGLGLGTYKYLHQARAACNRLQAACAGVAPVGQHYYSVIRRQDAQLRPAPGASAWLHRCSSAPRGRWRRAAEDACSPPGEDEVHRVLEWVPGISTLYNLGTSIYFAYEGCEEVASQRALEAAVDLGYDGLAVLSASAGGPVAYGVHLGLQPGLKAGVRELIRYFTSDEAPPPAPTAHAGPVRVV